ncbi:MAG: DUF6065 family protein [Pseudomonadota bacterium]
MKKLRILQVSATPPHIHAGDGKRQWMDDTHQSFAYRCLPLSIANTHGWEVRCHAGFRVYWTGGNAESDLLIQATDSAPAALLPTNIFGHGILTFHIHALIETDPGWNIMCMGPPNMPKDGIAPLTGVIETDWSPYTFTMNWKVTRAHSWIHFAKDEPYAFLMPVPRNGVEDFQPTLEMIDPSSEKGRQHFTWTASRTAFNKDLKQEGSQAQQDKWQKYYYLGKTPGGDEVTLTPPHTIKQRLRPLKDLRTDAGRKAVDAMYRSISQQETPK